MAIKPYKVTRTITYGPGSYLDWCAEEELTPTQEGFKEFIRDWVYEDFHLIESEIGELFVEESEE